MDRARLCVLCCTRPVDPKWRPFCSRRCQLLDQARWAEETYRIESSPVSAPEDDADDDQDDG